MVEKSRRNRVLSVFPLVIFTMFTFINVTLNPVLKPTLFYVKITISRHRPFRKRKIVIR